MEQTPVQGTSNVPAINAHIAEMSARNEEARKDLEFWLPLVQAAYVFMLVSWAALINTPLLWGATAGFIFYLLLKQK